jgi:hypothetical protein
MRFCRRVSSALVILTHSAVRRSSKNEQPVRKAMAAAPDCSRRNKNPGQLRPGLTHAKKL